MGMKNWSQLTRHETQQLKKKMGRAPCSMHKTETVSRKNELEAGDQYDEEQKPKAKVQIFDDNQSRGDELKTKNLPDFHSML
jgi:hypothetical protein